MQEYLINLAKKIKPAHVVLALMVLFLLFNGSLYDWFSNRMEVRKLTQRNIEADKESAALSAQLAKLQAGDAKYLEAVARTKYNLSKPGEIEIRLVPPDPKDAKKK